MKFDKEHKVIIETLTKEQAPHVVSFFEDEIVRHKKAIEVADFMWSMSQIIGEIYDSAHIRHQEEIDKAVLTIERVEEMFEL